MARRISLVVAALAWARKRHRCRVQRPMLARAWFNLPLIRPRSANAVYAVYAVYAGERCLREPGGHFAGRG